MSLEDRLYGTKIDKHVGGRLHLFRTGIGMSIDDFAAGVGVSVDVVGQWESGTGRIPSEHILASCALLHLHLGELFDGPG